MQCKYYQILHGQTCEWSLWRGGRFEVVFKTGSTVFINNNCLSINKEIINSFQYFYWLNGCT